MMTKKAQVIALPYKESEIVSPQEAGRYIDVLTRHESPVTGFTWDYRRYMDGMIAQNPYHLYFTIEDNTWEGDWFISENGDIMYQSNSVSPVKQQKIVACTNPDLWGDGIKVSRPYGIVSFGNYNVAKIGTDFLEAYVREQGNIKEVLLEYEEYKPSGFVNPYESGSIPKQGFGAAQGSFTYYVKTRIKLRPNGTVIIHPIKERTWTDEQVKEILFKALIKGENSPWDKTSSNHRDYVNNWFNKNYPKI